MTTDEAIDTAALDAELAEHLLGWTWWVHNEGNLHPGRRYLGAGGDDGVRPATGLEPLCPDPASRVVSFGLSTTGDGRALIEAALIDRGYSLCLHIFKGVTFVDVFKPHAGPAFPVPVVEDVEAPNTNLAVALAAQAALQADEDA